MTKAQICSSYSDIDLQPGLHAMQEDVFRQSFKNPKKHQEGGNVASTNKRFGDV